MGLLKLDISMSLDGYIAGPNQSVDNPLGEGGEQLHEWAIALASWRAPHGLEGGETNANTAVMDESLENIGAVVMGRGMFGGGPGPWGDWEGWWGDDPPFHVPVFVVTNHAREPLVKDGGTTFTFVTEGIEAALEAAKEAAGDENVSLGGGADVAQQYLKAGLLDEFQIHVVPVLLGGGSRLLDNVGDQVKVECTRVIEAPGVTHLTYRVVK